MDYLDFKYICEDDFAEQDEALLIAKRLRKTEFIKKRNGQNPDTMEAKTVKTKKKTEFECL